MTSRILFAAAGATFIAALAASNLMTAGSATAAPPADREEIETIVREYLLEHPEVIFEAVERYSARESERARAIAEGEIRNTLPTLLSGDTGHVMGADVADTEVLVVEFYDYHCSFCRNAVDMVMDLSEQKGVRVVLQELPVITQRSQEVAIASLSVTDPAAFKKFHRALFDISGPITDQALASAARKAGLKPADLQNTMTDKALRQPLEQKLNLSFDMAASFGIDGTPAFIIASPDGKFVRLISGMDEYAIKQAVDDAKRS
ncbi:DsbA family protein [Parvularcula sp. LCG005]|uniref:DsbA family protein n=1 Tax=Parvularcula sp. LCG005 TaxID=3078805 RepID=UPI00294273E8|nr:DsbA family protein [Parvularcula sp. LCG005]WOI52109.1 DsbA family protein [Parvularcula sp. LCG005]